MAATYSVLEKLRDGRSVVIRALKPEDRSAMLSAVGRVSAQSLYRRFFGPKRSFTEKEIDFFVNVDFTEQIQRILTRSCNPEDNPVPGEPSLVRRMPIRRGRGHRSI